MSGLRSVWCVSAGRATGAALCLALIGVAALTAGLVSRQVGERSGAGEALPSAVARAGPLTQRPDRGAPESRPSAAAAVRRALRLEGGPADPSIEALAATLRDEEASLRERRAAGWALAVGGGPEQLAVLVEALGTAPSTVKAAIAEALGHSSDPEALRLLTSLLFAADETAARGAVRGLAAGQSARALPLLAELLRDPTRSASLRSEAALALAELEAPAATAELIESFDAVEDGELAEWILVALGKRPYLEVAAFFEDLLTSPAMPAALQVAALEGLAGSDLEAVPLLLRLAGEAGDPELRAAAARALADLEEPGDSSVDLLLLLDAEESAEVRGALYEAIANQSGAPVDRVLRAAASESDPTVRLQGFQSVAALLPSRSDERLAADFDLLALPELRDRARSGGSPASRIAALNALKAAATPGTTNALRDLALAAPPPDCTLGSACAGAAGSGAAVRHAVWGESRMGETTTWVRD